MLAAAAVLVTGAGAAAFLLLRAPGDVYDPRVGFSDETPTPTPQRSPRRGRTDTFRWPLYGYTKDHRRAFDPRRSMRGKWNPVWKRKASALLEFPPVIAGGMLIQLADDGVLRALDKRTGRTRWQRKLGRLAASTPALGKNTLYTTLLESSRSRRRGRIVALRVRDGKIRWSRTLPSRSESSPVLDSGKVYFGSENGTVYALRAGNGRTVWTYRAAGAVKASPTLANRTLYFGDYGGSVHAIRTSTGRPVWVAGIARRALRAGTFYATAAVAYGRVYIGSTDGREYSLSARNGAVAWARQTGGYVYSSAAVATVPRLGPTVYFGSYDGRFYAVDARSGRTRWSFRSGGKISGSPTIVGDVVYFADLGRSRTFGLDTRTGRVVFRKEQGGYDPVVSDGRYLFLTGRHSVTALLPPAAATKARIANRPSERVRRRRARRAAHRRAAARARSARRTALRRAAAATRRAQRIERRRRR